MVRQCCSALDRNFKIVDSDVRELLKSVIFFILCEVLVRKDIGTCGSDRTIKSWIFATKENFWLVSVTLSTQEKRFSCCSALKPNFLIKSDIFFILCKVWYKRILVLGCDSALKRNLGDNWKKIVYICYERRFVIDFR